MEMVMFNKYAEFKTVMDAEIKGAVQGFVNIGYLLKVARDTNILYESGYASVAEFAKEEYGLTKDVVSRYIRINDRFSENGYSMKLRTEYENYGVGKLQEMLALPEEINEVLVPQLSKEQIAEVRREYQEEQKITDMEVYLEEEDEGQQSLDTTLGKTIFQYLKENKITFKKIDEAIFCAENEEERLEMIFKALAPKGFNNLCARISGMGKIMVVITGRDKEIKTINMRTSDKETYSWKEIVQTIRSIWKIGNALAFDNMTERYECIYNQMFKDTGALLEEKVEVAPVQQITEKVVENKVCKSNGLSQIETEKKILSKEEMGKVQQKENEDVKEIDIKEEVISVEDKTDFTEIQTPGEIPADYKQAEYHSEIPVQRQNETDRLKKRRQEVIEAIHSEIEGVKAAVKAENWDMIRLRLSDIRTDVNEIEQIEREIEDIQDMSQMRIEDYE